MALSLSAAPPANIGRRTRQAPTEEGVHRDLPPLPGRVPRPYAGTVTRWRDLSTVVLTLCCAALIVRFGNATASPDPLLPWYVDAALGAAGCVALWWRHRWSLALALGLT